MKLNRNIFYRWQALVPTCIAVISAGGCVEPNYRNEVTANAQGGVEVHRVARDDPSPLTAAPPSPAARPLESTTAPPEVTVGQSIDDRIAALEAQAARIDEEITKLKLEKATASKTP